ncbi:DUF4352 domain-containing protein [Actinoplanes sp. NPDC048988]|uniref:DUF4352 domain-containing protein n=1 Tax=Actinoplanes sp. NPDC048988 TaxID=3363901 RepID=UPI003719812D
MIAPAPASAPSRWPRVLGGFVVLAVLAAAALLVYAKWRERDDGEVLTTEGGQLNIAVVDGRFIFRVTAVRCRVGSLGEGSVDLEPKGSFCLVDIVARNGSAKPVTFDGTAQKGYDAAGAEYSTDMQAEVIVNPDRNFVDPIAPSAEARGTLVFDLPRGGTLASVVLHESFHTTGAKVALT